MMKNFITHLEGLIGSKVAMAKDGLALLKLEAKLAGLNIMPLLINLALFVALFFSTWLMFMILIGYGITLLLDPIRAFFITFFLNICVLGFVLKKIFSCINQMSFQKTRALLSHKQHKDNHALAKKNTEIN